MRTKSAGSTNGTGYITPSKPVGRLTLNFMRPSPSEGCLQWGRDRCGIVEAAQHHLVEADRAVLGKLVADLLRRAASGMPAHNVIVHQPVDLAPVLGGISRRQRLLVEARAAEANVLGMM